MHSFFLFWGNKYTRAATLFKDREQTRVLGYLILILAWVIVGIVGDIYLSEIKHQQLYLSLYITMGILGGILLIFILELERKISFQHTMDENKQILSAISSILIGISTNNTVTHWNNTAELVFGISASQMIGKPFYEAKINWDWEQIKAGIAGCRPENKKIRLDDIHFSRADGSVGELGITLTPIMANEHKLSGFLLFGSDITERKQIDRQLLVAQKFKSIGELATGIAHEINTPTQYVGSNIRFFQAQVGTLRDIWTRAKSSIQAIKADNQDIKEVLRLDEIIREVDDDPLIKEIPVALQESLDGLEQISKIVMAMKEFSHPGYGEKTLTDINRIIESTILVSRNEWKYKADLEMDSAPDLPLIPAYPNELKQTILNLIVNASDAIGEVFGDGSSGKGMIKISTKQINDWVEIKVSDNGSGMPEHIQGFVFDPFFTTKDVGKGSGQGLAITYNIIVDRHKGNINFESGYGKGTTFIIRLPINAK